MTRIIVYDDTAEMLENLAERMGTSIAEVIDLLAEFTNELETEN